ncbi:MAG: HAMP domain-containing histidine kinase [Bifidobacteriaceae bacterium]|jgi:signal transduction histidine kinase|nr:HAMP domain-containing histidine kinase [Bifidobacteriaceae bacterium]
MKTRRYAVALVVVLAAVAVVVAALIPRLPGAKVDLPAINDVTQTLLADADRLGAAGYSLPRPAGVGEYSVLAPDGAVLASTSPVGQNGPADTLSEALNRGDTVVDLVDPAFGKLLARVAFVNTADVARAAYVTRVRAVALGGLALTGAVCGLFLWRLHRRLVKPFHDMQGFAQRVAMGDLDAPLLMDKGGSFGAFTESFDLMRTELAAARDRERQAEVSKKELVASLSHDIKTPVASIRAMAELMAAQATDPAVRGRLETVQAKADQIDTLVSNLFNATLEDLTQLKVEPVPVAAGDIGQLIREADVRGLVGPFTLPECLVLADPLRVAQVIDNLVSNAYKYAGTPMVVAGDIEGGELVVRLADQGPGVAEDELPLLTQKFYRGAVAAGQPGAGLGLHLASHFMAAMGGSLTLANAAGPPSGVPLGGPLGGAEPPSGLVATLRFPLA